SICAQNKNKGFLKRHTKTIFVIINLVIVAVGLVLYKSIFSLFPLIGVILHTSAFWIDKEKAIRLVSFLGSPFWLCYNLVSAAYGSAIGDVFTLVSIGIAIFRYDIKNNKNTKSMGA
ncbi:MAG: YgjV family protein, partial [Clostridia bacterium]|nr:YgjV family protein [Clostridia bacterium]